jgi:homoserine dehydrogenase
VHPTLFSQDHPLASINGVLNAVFINTTPLGSILLSGKGAGQMPAASGIISDLIHLASRQQAPADKMLANLAQDDPTLTIQKMDDVLTRFYLRFMTTDKPGVLANITGILGNHGISINSVSQKAHNKIASVPVIMLTDYAPEKDVRQALKEIQQLPVVKAKPVAIRMENLT